MDKSQLLKNTQAFPGSTVVTFDGNKVTLDELRGGHSMATQTFGAGTPCPKCKSTQTVKVMRDFACNVCGYTWV